MEIVLRVRTVLSYQSDTNEKTKNKIYRKNYPKGKALIHRTEPEFTFVERDLFNSIFM